MCPTKIINETSNKIVSVTKSLWKIKHDSRGGGRGLTPREATSQFGIVTKKKFRVQVSSNSYVVTILSILLANRIWWIGNIKFLVKFKKDGRVFEFCAKL